VQIRWCRAAGFLHDIGMLAIPDHIVEKTTALTADESARIQEHCEIGREILQPFPHLGPVPEYVYLHHERVDGSGYPTGIRGDEIPLCAQIVAAADSYQALVETRPFRPAHAPAEAMEILTGTAGIWHYPEVLRALARVVPTSDS
jgi:HD-GYP domain-containing protein (c-di-GMP phosphodiesterase class II)